VLKYAIQILFFLVLLVVGLCIYRDYGISSDEPFSRANGAVTLKYVAERFARIYRDYGISSDEPFSRANEAVTLKYVAERFAPSLIKGAANSLPSWVARSSLNEWPDRDYGIAFEAPAVALEVILGISNQKNVYMFRHLLTFLVALSGIFAVHRMVERRFSDWRIGLLAALFLVLTPRLFAESFYNSKDVVFMAFFAIAMNTMIKFVLDPSFRSALLHGLASAVAIDVRIMAVILPTATVTILIIRLLKRELPIPLTCRAVAGYLAAACIFVLMMWPWLWSDPIGNIVQAFMNMTKFRWPGEVRYMGRFVLASDLPWHYIPVWISITTPLLYLGLFIVGAFNTLRNIASRGMRLWNGDEELQDAIFLGLFATPILAVILLRSVLYDGWRQLYFIYPAFLLVAIGGWISLWGKNLAWTIRKSVLAVITAISMVYTAAWMWRAHPFQNVYFNTLAWTDLRSQYELDYWGLANRKALEYILNNDKSEVVYVQADSDTPLATAFEMIDEQDRRRLKYSDDPNLSRYAITNYRGVRDLDDAKYANDYVPFYRVQVDDEVILSVFHRKEP